MEQASHMRVQDTMRKKQRLPLCLMWRAKHVCFSSPLDRLLAAFHWNGALPLFVRE